MTNLPANRNNLPANRNTFSADVVSAKMDYARALAEAGMLPDAFKRNPGNVLWAIEYGESLGICTITAITSIHAVKNKPVAGAGLISGLVRRSGHKLCVTSGPGRATAVIIRNDDPDFEFTVTWTIQMAQNAGLASSNTRKSYPDAMLKARAITQVARDACQEELNGLVYTPEEMGANVELDDSGEQVIIHQVTSVQARRAQNQPAPPPVAAPIVAGQVKDPVVSELRGDVEAAKAFWAEQGLPLDNNVVIGRTEVHSIIQAAKDRPVEAEVVNDEPTVPAAAEQAADDLPDTVGGQA